MTANIIVLTSCSASQAVEAPKELRGGALPEGLSIENAVQEWCSRLTAYQGAKYTPQSLYQGIAFYAIGKMSSFVPEENIFITSIGQGLVGLTQEITPYDLSIEKTHPHCLQRVITGAFKPAVWWATFNKEKNGTPRPITDMVAKMSDPPLVVVACGSDFLEMISEDLVTLVATTQAELRIIRASKGKVPTRLRPHVIQYDKRINQISVGNRNDTNQRAALHFLELKPVREGRGGMGIHQAAVDIALEELPQLAVSSSSASVSNAEIQAFLRSHTDEAKELGIGTRLAELVREHYSKPVKLPRLRRAYTAIFGIEISTRSGKDATDAAAKALEIVDFSSAGGRVWETEALKDIALLVDTLKKQKKTDVALDGARVFAWLEAYYHAQKAPPSYAGDLSKGKIAQLLRRYHVSLGLKPLDGEKGSKSYGLE